MNFFKNVFSMFQLHLELVYSKNYFNLTEIFVLRLFKESVPGRGLSTKLLVADHVKFMDECMMCTKK